MSAALTGIGRLLAAPWRWRLNQSRPVLVWGGLLAAVLAFGVLPLVKGWVAVAFASAFGGMGLLVGAWIHTVAGLRRQNHPLLARLVPGHVRRLREALLLLWALPIAAVAAGVVALGGDGWLAALITGGLLSLFTAFLRWPLTFVLVWMVPGVAPLWNASGAAEVLTPLGAALWLRHAGLVALLVLGVLGALQLRFIGTGDEAHLRRQERLDELPMLLKEGATGATLRRQGRLGQGFLRAFTVFYRGWMAHLLDHPRATPGHVVARLELVLHGLSLWAGMLGTVVLLLALGLAGVGVLALVLRADTFAALLQAPQTPGWVLLAAGNICLGLTMGMVVGQVQQLYRSRREQALLALVPGVPPGGELRSRLLRRQALQCFVTFLCGQGLLVLAHSHLAMREGHWHPASVGLGLAAGVVLLLLLPLLPWQRRVQPPQALQLLLGLGGYVLWMTLVPDGWSFSTRSGAMLAGTAIVGLAWLLVIRQSARDAAPALPVGRGVALEAGPTAS